MGKKLAHAVHEDGTDELNRIVSREYFKKLFKILSKSTRKTHKLNIEMEMPFLLEHRTPHHAD